MLKSVILLFFSLNIWLFGLTLKDGLQETLKYNPEVQVRENDLKQIKYDIDRANGLDYPTLDLTATIEDVKETTQKRAPSTGNSSKNDQYNLNVTQPLYDGFQAQYEQKLQKARYFSAQNYLKEAQNSLALQYTQSYINVLKIKDLLSLSGESYQIGEDIFNKVAKKVEKGFGTKLEFERAKASFEEKSVNYTIDKLSYNEAIQGLKNYVKQEIDGQDLIKPAFIYKIPENETNALDFALTHHPSMMVSTINTDVALNEYRRDLDSFQPKVNLFGTYRLNDSYYKENTTDITNEYRVGIEVAYNLYNGGRDYAKSQQALEQVNQKKILINKSKYDISNSLALSWNSYMVNQEKLERLRSFLKTRKLVLDTTFEEFDLGLKDLTSIIDAHDDYIATKRSTIITTYDLLYAHFRVLESMGILSDEILMDKRDEFWGQNRVDINKILKEVTEDLRYAYNANADIQQEKSTTPEVNEPLMPTNEFSYENTNVAEMKNNTEMKAETVNTDNSTLSFKEKFLNASATKYTVNLATFTAEERANKFITSNNLQENAFAFKFGEPSQFFKVMYGIYDTYAEATEAINAINKQIIGKNQPRVEPIEIKQLLYKKYNTN